MNLESQRILITGASGGIFAGYRLRVASVLRDYTHAERGQAPADSVALHG